MEHSLQNKNTIIDNYDDIDLYESYPSGYESLEESDPYSSDDDYFEIGATTIAADVTYIEHNKNYGYHASMDFGMMIAIMFLVIPIIGIFTGGCTVLLSFIAFWIFDVPSQNSVAQAPYVQACFFITIVTFILLAAFKNIKNYFKNRLYNKKQKIL